MAANGMASGREQALNGASASKHSRGSTEPDQQRLLLN
jgi:hypothetical protein